MVAQVSITCPSDKTIYTNTDGVNNFNNGSMITAAVGVSPVIVDPKDLQVLRYEVTGATNSTGNGSVAGVYAIHGLSIVTYRLLPSDLMCTFTVNVFDNEAPRVVANSVSVFDGCGVGSIINSVPLFTDNCDAKELVDVKLTSDTNIDVYGCETKSPSFKYIYKNTKVWTATDLSGNSSTYSQVSYVRDNKVPIAVVKPVTAVVGNVNILIKATDFDNGSFDECSRPVSFSTCKGIGCTNFSSGFYVSRSDIRIGDSQTIPVRVRVKDYCGNINIVDTTILVKKSM